MGRVQKKDSNVIFYSINGDGDLAQRVPEGTPDAEPRELKKGPKAGTIIHEVFIEKIQNVLLDEFKIENHDEYGSQIKLTLRDMDEGSEEVYKINFSLNGKYGSNLIKRIESADLSKVMDLNPYNFISKDDGSKIVGISIVQDGKKIEQNYRKDDGGKGPSGVLPQPTEETKLGKTVLNWDEPNEFLYNIAKRIESEISMSNAVAQSNEAPAQTQSEDAAEYLAKMEEDDLPI
jgi:hypothetical protein